MFLFRMWHPTCSLIWQCLQPSPASRQSRAECFGVELPVCSSCTLSEALVSCNYFWVSLWLLFAFLYHSAFYLRIFNYPTFIAEHLETSILKCILGLSSEAGIRTIPPVPYSYFSIVFWSLALFPVCVCLMSFKKIGFTNIMFQ